MKIYKYNQYNWLTIRRLIDIRWLLLSGEAMTLGSAGIWYDMTATWSATAAVAVLSNFYWQHAPAHQHDTSIIHTVRADLPTRRRRPVNLLGYATGIYKKKKNGNPQVYYSWCIIQYAHSTTQSAMYVQVWLNHCHTSTESVHQHQQKILCIYILYIYIHSMPSCRLRVRVVNNPSYSWRNLPANRGRSFVGLMLFAQETAAVVQ